MKKPTRCPIADKYLFARSFFKNARAGVTIGVMAGREQVERYTRNDWHFTEPQLAARIVHMKWGCL